MFIYHYLLVATPVNFDAYEHVCGLIYTFSKMAGDFFLKIGDFSLKFLKIKLTFPGVKKQPR